MSDIEIVHIGLVTSKSGRTLFESQPHVTREECVAECFLARPRAKECSTSRGARIEIVPGVKQVMESGADIRWHRRKPGIPMRNMRDFDRL